MNAGEFKRRITIYNYQEVENELGTTELAPVVFAKTWAKIEQLRGWEYYEAKKIKDADYYKVTIRYRKGITRDMIIKYGDTTLEIQTPNDLNTAHELLELRCVVKER